VTSRHAEPSKRRRFFISLAGGYAWQNLYATNIRGGDFEVALGAESPKFSIGGDVEIAVGSTEFGLTTLALVPGFLIEGRGGPFRFGGGVRLGFFHVTRATDGTSLGSLGAGLYARITLDLVRFGLDPTEDPLHRAVFLMARASADDVGGTLYGVVGGAGVRF
jgi:hypothetical protein